jgi:hypothetical protein
MIPDRSQQSRGPPAGERDELSRRNPPYQLTQFLSPVTIFAPQASTRFGLHSDATEPKYDSVSTYTNVVLQNPEHAATILMSSSRLHHLPDPNDSPTSHLLSESNRLCWMSSMRKPKVFGTTVWVVHLLSILYPSQNFMLRI